MRMQQSLVRSSHQSKTSKALLIIYNILKDNIGYTCIKNAYFVSLLHLQARKIWPTWILNLPNSSDWTSSIAKWQSNNIPNSFVEMIYLSDGTCYSSLPHVNLNTARVHQVIRAVYQGTQAYHSKLRI